MYGNNYGGYGSSSAGGSSTPSGPAGGGLSGTYPDPELSVANQARLDPVTITPDGKERYESDTNATKSWQEVVIVSGTSAGNKIILQAGTPGNWVNGQFTGVITGTKGGESFWGQDATNSLYYIYIALSDNVWYRALSS